MDTTTATSIEIPDAADTKARQPRKAIQKKKVPSAKVLRRRLTTQVQKLKEKLAKAETDLGGLGAEEAIETPSSEE